MKKHISTLSITLLLINGISACYGGLCLITDTTGAMLGLSLNQLVFLPFKTYLIPGILLLSLNGISSLFIALLVSKRKKNAGLLVIFQGCLLVGWIVIQAFSIPNNFLQFLFGIIGVLLIYCGIILFRIKTQYMSIV